MKRLFAFLYVGLVMSMVGAGSAVAQTASALYEFGGGGSGDGDEPTVLIQAQDGNFYGITAYGGNASGCTDDNGVPTGCGTIFKISPGGSESVLYKFSGGTDGGIPNSLIQGPDGNIYGTTLIGGQPPSSPNQCNISSPSNPGQTAGPCCPPDSNGDAVGCGTIFVFAPTQAASVTPTTLYSFTGTADGGSPGTLIVGTNSSGARLIFGTTLSCSNCFYPSSSGLFYPTGGTIFSFALPVSTPFKPNTLATFSTQLAEFPKLGTNANLAFPNSLIQTDQNTLYGTTQMGGVTSTGQNAVCQTEFGCGGVFELELASSNLVDICHFGDLIDVTPPAIGACNSADVPQPASLPQAQAIEKSGKPSPEIIVAQSGVRFPTGGSLWGFTTEPIALVADSSGNIYGTTPPGCVDPSYSLPYTSDPNCASDHPDDFVNAVQGTVFELTPSTGSVTFPYSFSGNGPSPTSPPSDGGGSEAGITLATDGNFYGLSGDGATAAELFTLQVPEQTITQYTSLDYFSLAPTWMIQGSNGNFFGTSTAEGLKETGPPVGGIAPAVMPDVTLVPFYGSIFEIAPSPSLQPPVQLSFSQSPITLGEQATLNWKVMNAYSLTSQQCSAFEEGANAATAGTWSGLQKGSPSNNVYGSSAFIVPTAATAGTPYTYALTCGGVETGSATLVVVTAPPVTVTPLASSITTTQSLGVTVTVSGTPTPTGTVKVSGGGYTSPAMALSSGSATITIPAGTLPPASYTLTASYTPDSASSSTYGSSTGTAASSVSVSLTVPTITWTPATTIIRGSLGVDVLNATANTAGTFTYSATPVGGGSAISLPDATDGLLPGIYNIVANFTPSNTGLYDSAQATATLYVSGEIVWVVDGTGGLSELAGNGAAISLEADPSTNLGVAIDVAGTVWTIGSGSIPLEETIGGVQITIASGTGGLNAPTGIAVDGFSQIWVANGDNSVSLISSAGTALSPASGFTDSSLSTPSGIAIDLSGSVWITNKGSNSITRIVGAAAPVAPLATAAANKKTGSEP